MLLTRLLSRPAKPDANEKNRIAAKRLHPEYDARMKQTASPTIPLKITTFKVILFSKCYSTPPVVVKILLVFLTLKYSLLTQISLNKPKLIELKKFKI